MAGNPRLRGNALSVSTVLAIVAITGVAGASLDVLLLGAVSLSIIEDPPADLYLVSADGQRQALGAGSSRFGYVDILEVTLGEVERENITATIQLVQMIIGPAPEPIPNPAAAGGNRVITLHFTFGAIMYSTDWRAPECDFNVAVYARGPEDEAPRLVGCAPEERNIEERRFIVTIPKTLISGEGGRPLSPGDLLGEFYAVASARYVGEDSLAAGAGSLEGPPLFVEDRAPDVGFGDPLELAPAPDPVAAPPAAAEGSGSDAATAPAGSSAGKSPGFALGMVAVSLGAVAWFSRRRQS